MARRPFLHNDLNAKYITSITGELGCQHLLIWGAGLTENKSKPSSWGLAELGNKLSQVGVVAEDMW